MRDWIIYATNARGTFPHGRFPSREEAERTAAFLNMGSDTTTFNVGRAQG